ncbi:cytochrome o ubiquinol oxidase subunit IV [Neoasaia chiangmaiensis NBRC 101099]|uniref:Cytochrome bo(3) ubiquinol oxidase subunit 4 n=1 Tax=Neoasaia chiangmaiensis TaxID=320497 RepID=A0A1U9KMU4_9PROT|nr:cytochrome o ubiquinol oxidase subunit IV [Neoasaia chiangmaiensis]AQS87124.1 cytochrome o ubiquinol oxidase subunit IV [Neoasaia chiangmaiensis]GBR38121.1 cytochrome o ubiquinol oxidase subunit IV [Neoasaia chiangmaiensis NBRC 101099]GEN16038.1 cytochrome o ubiquinol oxidase subunit IV [Neoasaia chiangmaiensis]
MSQAPTTVMTNGESGESHGSYASYLIGFVISVVLTAAAFAAVMMHVISPGATVGVIAFLAVVQIVVHMVFFLHMNGSSEQSWNLMAFCFAVACVLIIVGGTLFILHDTSINMMSR